MRSSSSGAYSPSASQNAIAAGSYIERGGEPGSDGGAEATRRLGDDVGTGALGLGRGRVAGSVVDHDDVHRVAADLGRRAGDDLADGPLLVAGGQDEHQRPGHQGTLTMVRLP